MLSLSPQSSGNSVRILKVGAWAVSNAGGVAQPQATTLLTALVDALVPADLSEAEG